MNKRMLEKFHFHFGQLNFLNKYTISVINGFFSKFSFKKHSVIFEMIIISRRENSNLGTRYNRRGLNDDAFVCNFVEIE